MEFKLLGEETSVIIRILGYAFPSSEYTIDREMLNSHIKINIPGYDVDFPTMISTADLEKFLTSMKMMYENMAGRSTFSHREDAIQIKGEINKLGHIDWDVETCYPVGTGAILTFEFTSDQSYLAKLMKELEMIVATYEV